MRSFRIRFFREGFQGMTKLPAVRADENVLAGKKIERWAANGPPGAQNATGNPAREWPKADPAVTSGILDGDSPGNNQDALRA
jgi:hypothetical protein